MKKKEMKFDSSYATENRVEKKSAYVEKIERCVVILGKATVALNESTVMTGLFASGDESV